MLQSYIVETEDGLVIRRNRKHLSDLPQCCPEYQQRRAAPVLPNQHLPNILTVRDYTSPAESQKKCYSPPLPFTPLLPAAPHVEVKPTGGSGMPDKHMVVRPSTSSSTTTVSLHQPIQTRSVRAVNPPKRLNL